MFTISLISSNPEKKVSSKRKAKTLGDKSFVPSSQTMGMIAGHGLAEDVETFAKLAHGYVFDGSDKTAICSRNAEVYLRPLSTGCTC